MAGLVLGVTVPIPWKVAAASRWCLVSTRWRSSTTIQSSHAVGRSPARSAHRPQSSASQPLTRARTPGDPALDDCTSILEIGARWRARWTPDVSQPQHSVRLHAAGASSNPVHVASVAGTGDERDMNECALVHHQRPAAFGDPPAFVRCSTNRSANSPTRYVTSASPDECRQRSTPSSWRERHRVRRRRRADSRTGDA